MHGTLTVPEIMLLLEDQNTLLLGVSLPCLVGASAVSKDSDAMQALLLVLGKHCPGEDSSLRCLPGSGGLPRILPAHHHADGAACGLCCPGSPAAIRFQIGSKHAGAQH